VRLPVATAILDLNSEGIPGEGDDQRLIESLRCGSERAYEELLARFQQPVYTLAVRLLDSPSEASDVVQEVFLKVFRNIDHFRGQSTLKTWIYRITVNEAHNAKRWFFRHRRREVELDTDPQETRNWKETVRDGGRSPFDMAFDNERAGMLGAALERINPSFREAVVLRDIVDLSYEEIAEVLAVSLGTVKSRILRGREALREELAGDLAASRSLRLVPKTAE
jgi:RNA polymerase sigma-70 factor (ECF subfamily)